MKNIILYGLILVFAGSAPAQNARIAELVEQVDPENLRTHIDSLCYAGGHHSRISFTQGNYAAADYIARYLGSLPGLSYVVRDTFKLGVADPPYNTYPLINIYAVMEGQSDDPEIYILGGHYDASASRNSDYASLWGTRQAQGADDNASGSAVLIAVDPALAHDKNLPES